MDRAPPPHPLLGIRETRDAIESSTNCIAYSENGEVLACATAKGALAVHLVKEGKYFPPVPMLGGSEQTVLAFQGSESILHSTAASTGTLACLSLAASKYTRTMQGHGNQAYSISTVPGVPTVLTAAEGDPVLMWDIRCRTPVAKIPSRKRPLAKYTPDGKVFAIIFGERKELRLYDTRAYSKGPYATRQMQGAEGAYLDLVFSPDGHRALIPQQDALAHIDAFTGQTLDTFTGLGPGIAYSPDGKYVLASEEAGITAYLSGDNLKPVHTWDTPGSERVDRIECNPRYAQVSIIQAGTVSLIQ